MDRNDAFYDDDRFGHEKASLLTTLAGATLGGTSGDVEVSRIRLHERSKITGVDLLYLTGGTCAPADASIDVQYSLGGTGSAVSFGTHAMGTTGANSMQTMTLSTSPVLDSGDQIILRQLAGTVGPEPVAQIRALWKPNF
jgi:hypothetical protein